GTLDTSSVPGPHARSTAPELIDGFVIPRAGWGADEKLRHRDQDVSQPVRWSPQYRTIEKIIIHHTVTENNPADVAASLRAIYYYHAITQGWGDIGYNFLIDWNGNVYEGRFGGPNVVGGHALQYNPGSIGIAMLGNFMSATPPQAMLDSLMRIISTRASHVDVTIASDFVDLLGLANLCGHGDVLSTSCPGDVGRTLLPTLRGHIAGTGPIELAPPIKIEWLDLVSCEIGPATVYQENLLKVRMKVRNPSITTIVSSTPEPGYVYDEGQTFETAGFPKIQDTYRFGIDFTGNTGLPNPYRWGFGAPIKPGEEREVVGYVRVKDVASRTYSASIVKEFAHYLTQNRFPKSVAISKPPVGSVADAKLDGGQFFSVTGHNVPRVFNDYWQQRGGLRRFGYPLTEAYEEVSETDGGRYLTQYFERARFERHPAYAGTQFEVQLGLLGAELEASRSDEPAFQRAAPFTSTDARWFMPETGHSLAGIFKQVWIERGGLQIFGYPISEEFPELSATDGNWHMVQYFERNRFEHHLDYQGTDDEVMLGHLGREVLIRRGWMARPAG
ncbi:MAG TPA: N-acetylmuramoyl-L-alanine amidase, partial [Thermomicrobiales bacterium]|nr:N-acetylmuramoyl-L-alanine amidase [Thermomicrobiales bacterium]